jgi:hypothetical protein
VPTLLANPPAQNRASRRGQSGKRILNAPRPLALWHLASIDAPTVAVVWSLAFAWAANIRLPIWVPLLLALTTWPVYVGDRLLDVRSCLHRNRRNSLRERHYFHWRHRRVLLPLAVVAACAAAGIVFALMPPIGVRRDSILAAAALVYFSGVHGTQNVQRPAVKLRRSFPSKELLVGLLFTAGCAMPAWQRIHASAAPGTSVWQFWIPAAYFAALASLNCFSIARWESADLADGARSDRAWMSFARSARIKSPNFLSASLLATAGGLLATLASTSHSRPAALLAAGAASALLLVLLDRTRHRITPLALRAAADLVLLTPALLLLR